MSEGGAGGSWLKRAYGRGQRESVRESTSPAGNVAIVDQCAHIDVVYAVDGDHVLLVGWAENAELGPVFLDTEGKVTELDAVFVPRPDVGAHLRALGRKVQTSRHGFLATIPGLGATASLRIERAGRWLASPAAAVNIQRVSLMQMLAMALNAAEQSGGGIGKSLEQLARPFVPENSPPPAVALIERFGPVAGESPRASIIVPFYGDLFYLLDHIAAQRRAPDDVEWVFVCDDPALSSSFSDAIKRQRTAIRQPTTVLYLQANGGFAHANNVGAAHARGRRLLLMNSDVYCETFAFLDEGLRLMDDDPAIGIVGFSLQFEDGTVQHEGMRFTKAHWFRDLWISEHPGKGLSQAWASGSSADVPAVTAALMLLDRQSLVAGQIFDPGYALGDFEDGDLCLRLRQAGKRIVLLRTPGLFHLERQSVRRLGEPDGRRALTLLNCLRFNARWSGTLRAGAGAPA